MERFRPRASHRRPGEKRGVVAAGDHPGALFAERAAELNAVLAKCDAAAAETVRWMVEAGRLLHDVWGKLPHGEYEAWVSANCRVTTRMARLYRQAYRKSLTLEPETISDFRRRQ